jgi:hypothetical protein
MNRAHTVFLAAALCLFVNAEAATETAITKCRTLTDAAARLACYDAINLGAIRTDPTPVGGAAALVAPRAEPSKPSSSTHVADAGANKTKEFGFEARAAVPTTGRIDSTIAGSFQGWSPNSRIRLTNGQVWQVTDDTARSLDLNQPKVSVRRGAFGSFYLEIEGTNHSPRVRRVE